VPTDPWRIVSRPTAEQNAASYQKYIKPRNEQSKLEALRHYGREVNPKCRCCGETILQFLQLDHINGDGAEHRKEISKNRVTQLSGGAFYKWLQENAWPQIALQVLCANCNLGKRRGKYCPHEIERGLDLDGNFIDKRLLNKPEPKLLRAST